MSKSAQEGKDRQALRMTEDDFGETSLHVAARGMRSMSRVLAGAHVCAKQRGAVEGDAAIHGAVGDPLHDCNGLVELLPTKAKDPKDDDEGLTRFWEGPGGAS